MWPSIIFYCSLPLIVFAVDILFTKTIKNVKIRKIVLICFYIVFFAAIIGLRSPSVGIDTPGYKTSYELYGTFSFSQLFSKTTFEKGYTILTWALSKIGIPFIVFNFAVALVCVIPMVLLTFRLSKIPSMSLVLYLTFGWFTFNMSAIRQSIAIGLCLIAVYILILLRNKKWYWQLFSLLPIIAAYFFHETAVIFAAIYPLMFIPFKKKVAIGYFVMVSLLLVMFAPAVASIGLMNFMKNGLSYSFAPPVESFAVGGTAILLFVFFIIYIVTNTFNVKQFDLSFSRNKFFNAINKAEFTYNEVEYSDKYAVALILIFFFSFVLDLFVHLFARIGLYGALGFCVLFPNVLLRFSSTKKINPLIYLGIILAAILYFYVTTLRVNYLTLLPYGVF